MLKIFQECYNMAVENVSPIGTEINLKIFTLNCWGLKLVSKLKKERFHAIAEYLSQSGSGYDVVFLQEVWCREHFEVLKAKLCCSKDLYPYSHYFNHGVIGSGTCIFSKFRLLQANYHEFSVNGYPTKFWHGDWFASKGIGVCQIRFASRALHENTSDSNFFDIHLYMSHYHADYDPDNDRYIAHRVLQAFESAQWINLTSSGADLIIYAGDFNTEPQSLPYRILCSLGSLKDSWKEFTNNISEDDKKKLKTAGSTSESLVNSFTVIPTSSNCSAACIGNGSTSDAVLQIEGKRIDYIMYRPGRNIVVKVKKSSLLLPATIPHQNFSFSDHEALDAIISLRRGAKNSDIENESGKEKVVSNEKDMVNVEEAKERHTVIQEAIDVMETALDDISKSKTKYWIFSILCLVLFLASFISSGFSHLTRLERIALDLCLFFPRMLLVAGFIIYLLMGLLFSKREKNSIKEIKNQLTLMLEED